MIKFLPIAAAIAATLTPLTSHAATSSTFEYGGERYIYTATETKGATRIRGYVEKGNVPFALSVRNGRVSGTVDGRHVSFRMAEVKALGSQATIAAR